MTWNLNFLRNKGFTLTELAIVLVIVALLIGGMLAPLSAQRDLQAVTETQKQLEEIKAALTGFAVTNGRLPRPAPTLANGTERALPCADESECTGFIPWITLGVKKTDAWNKMIIYSVTPAFANSAFSLGAVGSKKVQTRDNVGNISYLIGGPACNSTTTPCAPAVIFSFGKNNWGTTETGTPIADGSTTNTDEDTNAAANTIFFSRDQSTVPTGGEFDDIVIWIAPTILFNQMISARRLP